MKTENQEGKHTPEQKILIPEQKRKEWREAITMIFAGVGHPDSIHFYTMGRSDEFASQSSELSKREKEVERLNNYLSEANKENAKLGASLTEREQEVEKWREEADLRRKEGDATIAQRDGLIATLKEELSKLREDNENLKSIWSSMSGELADLNHSLTEKDAEIEKLKLERDNAYREGCETRNHEMEAKDKELDQLRFSLQCAATDANDLRESNRELFEALTAVRPYLAAVGTNGNHWLPQVDAALSKAKPTE